MRWIFAALALWGAIHPMAYFITWFQAEGWTLMTMVDAWLANAATTALAWDLVISAIALTVWVLYETYQTRRFIGLITLPATFGIGVSCGLPLYIFIRMRQRP